MLHPRVETLEAMDGAQLYVETRRATEEKGLILSLHDFGSHSGAAHRLHEQLCQAGYTLIALDFRGHGKSPGERGDIKSWEDILEDLDLLIARLRDREKSPLMFILAQGIGALFASLYVCTRKLRLQGLILIGPALKIPLSAEESFLLRYLSPLYQRLPLAKKMSELLLGSSSAADPLHLSGPVPRQSALQVIGACAALQSQSSRLSCPVLAILGEQSQLGSGADWESWLDRLMVIDKTILHYAEADHRLWLKSDQDQIIGDIKEWCERHQSQGDQQDDQEEEEEPEWENDAL